MPSLWQLEVANALQMAIRRRCIDAVFRDATLADLRALNIAVDAEADSRDKEPRAASALGVQFLGT